MFLTQLVLLRLITSWLLLDKKLNSFGWAPKFSPKRYGNLGFLKLSNGSVASSVGEDSIVAKYA